MEFGASIFLTDYSITPGHDLPSQPIAQYDHLGLTPALAGRDQMSDFIHKPDSGGKRPGSTLASKDLNTVLEAEDVLRPICAFLWAAEAQFLTSD
jgi:hypothetical protein